jgi:hypothetical protein
VKKLTILLGCLLVASFALASEPSVADQKWLQAVQKMVAHGEKKVSTPNEDRVSLLKDWAGKNGYSVEVTKTSNGFSIDVSSKEAKTVAQK